MKLKLESLTLNQIRNNIFRTKNRAKKKCVFWNWGEQRKHRLFVLLLHLNHPIVALQGKPQEAQRCTNQFNISFFPHDIPFLFSYKNEDFVRKIYAPATTSPGSFLFVKEKKTNWRGKRFLKKGFNRKESDFLLTLKINFVWKKKKMGPPSDGSKCSMADIFDAWENYISEPKRTIRKLYENILGI